MPASLVLAVLVSGLAWAAKPSPKPQSVPAKTGKVAQGANPFLMPSKPRPPLPVGSPIPKGQRYQAALKSGKPVAETLIKPRSSFPANANYAQWFDMEHRGGKLVLSFHSKDPLLVLNSKGSLVIQINSDEPLEVVPEVVTSKEWDKAGGKELTLSYTGASTTEDNTVTGEASFMVCHSTTRQCTRKRNTFQLKFK